MTDNTECRKAFEEWFKDTPLPLVGSNQLGVPYTKEALEWAFKAGANNNDKLLREALRGAIGTLDAIHEYFVGASDISNAGATHEAITKLQAALGE